MCLRHSPTLQLLEPSKSSRCSPGTKNCSSPIATVSTRLRSPAAPATRGGYHYKVSKILEKQNISATRRAESHHLALTSAEDYVKPPPSSDHSPATSRQWPHWGQNKGNASTFLFAFNPFSISSRVFLYSNPLIEPNWSFQTSPRYYAPSNHPLPNNHHPIPSHPDPDYNRNTVQRDSLHYIDVPFHPHQNTVLSMILTA